MFSEEYQSFIDQQPLNKELIEIMEKYPDLRVRLTKHKIAMEWLEGGEYRLEQLWGQKKFAEIGPLLHREIVGMDGKSALEGEDIYLALNMEIPRAMSVLGMRRLARHFNVLAKRDRDLAQGLPNKNIRAMRQAAGKKGGEAKAAKKAPLHKEIDRLYREEEAKRPKEPLTFYASQIESKVSAFIEQDPDRYRGIGSGAGAVHERNYYDFIYRYLRKLKNRAKSNRLNVS